MKRFKAILVLTKAGAAFFILAALALLPIGILSLGWGFAFMLKMFQAEVFQVESLSVSVYGIVCFVGAFATLQLYTLAEARALTFLRLVRKLEKLKHRVENGVQAPLQQIILEGSDDLN